MKKYLLLFVLISGYTFSQSLNDYQYVIVPAKFDFFKKEDQFRTNTLTKLILQKYGLKAYLSNEDIPLDVQSERCSILYASASENNGMMLTKVKIVLKDCHDKVIYETEYGKSREKEFAAAYNEAFRDAGKSFDKLTYKYTGNKIDTPVSNAVKTQAQISTPETEEKIIPATVDSSKPFYFAQPNATGFQVVDNEPKVIMRLLSTSQKNVFIGVRGNSNGVVISKNGQWFFEYYENAKLVSEALNIKF